MENLKSKSDSEFYERPPVFKSWGTWYALVIGVLVAQIMIYFWLTVSFQ